MGAQLEHDDILILTATASRRPFLCDSATGLVFMFPARSHGRVLLSSARPSARLNLDATSTLTAKLDSIATACAPAPATAPARWGHWPPLEQKRFYSKAQATKLFETVHPIAKQLKDTRVWSTSPGAASVRTGKKTSGRPKKTGAAELGFKADRSRVNVVNEDLVRDTIEYIQPTLERNKGCDLISVYPGAGLWTKALHDAVQPRSHLLLEPDEDLYRPFLQPLLDNEGVCLIPKSGIVWDELNEVLSPENLPNQVEIKRSNHEPPPRNDTLLVSINLAMYPKKKYHLFDSISRMVLYQLVNSLRSSALFQKYGRVRMLVWVLDNEKMQLLPRVIHQRRRLAIEGELCTEYIAEVCGADSSAAMAGKTTSRTPRVGEEEGASKAESNWTTKRWGQIDLESVRLTLNRMHEAGIKTPEGRETHQLQQFKKLGLSLETPISLTDRISINDRLTDLELEALKQMERNEQKERMQQMQLLDSAASTDSQHEVEAAAALIRPKTAVEKRIFSLHHYHIRLDKEYQDTINFIKKFDKVCEAWTKAKSGPRRKAWEAKALKLEEALDQEMAKVPMYMVKTIMAGRDMLHLMRQPKDLGPVLCWDRRPYEPLPSHAVTDFFPNVPCALLDIQPKVADPLIRAMGPESNNSGDVLDLMIGSFLNQRSKSIGELLDIMYPGSREGILPLCTTLTDVNKGGIPTTGMSAMSMRASNQLQLLDVLDQFMRWPFRPTYPELVGRLAEDVDGDSSLATETDTPMGNTTMDPF